MTPGRALAIVVVSALAVVWFQQLRPQYLGGRTAYVTVAGTSMLPHLRSGDVVVVQQRSRYRLGDVVAYRIPRGEPGAGRVVIHRIAGGSARTGFLMRGDNRRTFDAWRPRPADVVGRHRVRVPGLARAAQTVVTPVGLGLLCGLLVFVLLATGRR